MAHADRPPQEASLLARISCQECTASENSANMSSACVVIHYYYRRELAELISALAIVIHLQKNTLACTSAIVYKYKKQLQKIEKKVGMEYQKAYKQG